jgi:hypothetical protein
MDIKRTIDQCERVVSDWAQRTPNIEMVEDFARALGFQLEIKVTPLVSISYVGPAEAAPPDDDVEKTSDDAQYEMFNELSVEDKYAMKSWRENNGLAWR